MAFVFFLILLEEVTRKVESFKVYLKNCVSTAMTDNPGVPSPGLHVQLQ